MNDTTTLAYCYASGHIAFGNGYARGLGDYTRDFSAARREARAAAIEECAKACADEAERWNGRSADRFWEATRLEGKMRALLSAPEPTQETER